MNTPMVYSKYGAAAQRDVTIIRNAPKLQLDPPNRNTIFLEKTLMTKKNVLD